MNEAGDVTFRSLLGGSNDSIWIDSGNGPVVVAETFSHAPGTGTGTEFGSFDKLVINSAGQVAINANLRVGTGDATSANDSGIWVGGINGLRLAARKGNQAPGSSGGSTFDAFTGVVMDGQGNIAFQSALSSGMGVYRESVGGGLLGKVLAGGDQLPGEIGTVVSGGGISSPTINESGMLGLRLHSLSGPGITGFNDVGLWVDAGGGLQEQARGGDAAPGAPNIFKGFNSLPILSDDGEIAYSGQVWLSGSGAWKTDNNVTTAVTSFSDPPPGTSGATTYNLLDIRPVINDAGQVAFISELVPTDGGGFTGIWAEDPSGELLLVARTGNTLEVAPGDIRTIESLQFNDFASTSGQVHGFNNVGQLVFLATFTDDSQGIFVSDIAASVSTPFPANGDYNSDGIVDAADYTVWRDTLGATGAGLAADGNHDGAVDAADYDLWEATYGLAVTASSQSQNATIPEPCSLLIFAIAAASLLSRRECSRI